MVSNFQDVTPDNLARARSLDLVIAVWTVNSLCEIDRMIAIGVDAIVTDYLGAFSKDWHTMDTVGNDRFRFR